MGESSMINTGVLNRNPFPGIRPFSSAEEKYYFGRGEAISEVQELIHANRFVALAGASACGKSSLIQSGIIPALLGDDRNEWVPVVLRPGQKPVHNLVREFQKVFPKKLREADVESFLKSSQDLSDLIVGKGLGSHRYLLVVDQFEELFMTDPGGAPLVSHSDSRRFLDLLVKAMKAERPEIYIILSIRSDYLEASSSHRQLTELMNRSKYLLPPMSHKAMSEAITGPVQQAGVRLEPGFTEYVLDDLDELELPLPRLQYAMMLSWERWLEAGDREQSLTINDYQTVGSVETALRNHLEAAYSSLEEQQKFICERMFKTLTSKSAQNNGFRKKATLGNMARIAHCSVEELTDVVEVFRNQGRGVLCPHGGNLKPDSSIEISHESLIRIWDRLTDWVEEEDESVKMYLRLSKASALYQQGRTELWSGADLQTAVQWRESQKPTPAWGVQYNPAFERAMVFLSTSEEELAWEEERKIIQQRRRLLLNRSIAIFMAVLVLALGAVFIVTRYMPDAIERPAEVALEENVAVESTTPVLEPEPEVESVTGPVEEVEAELTNPVAETPLTRPPSTAAEEQNTAQTETPNPVREQPQAQPEEQSPAPVSGMTRGAALELAQNLARESRAIERNPDLQGLLARQAYLIHQENGGKASDVEIYMGLYEAQKKLISPAYNIYPNIRSSVKDMAWLRRTGSVLTVSSDGTVKILSGSYASRASQISLPGTGFANECLALSPDEKKAAIGTNGGGVVFIELEDKGSIVHQDQRKGKTILFLQSLGNSGTFLSAGPDMRIFKWNFEDYTAEVMLTAASRISALTSTADGRIIAYATRDGKLYELGQGGSGKARLVGEFGKNHVRAISYNPSGQTMVVGLQDGTLKVLSGQHRIVVATLRGAGAGITDLEFSPDGSFLAATSRDSKSYLWRASALEESPVVFDENNGFVLSLCFSRSGAYFYTGSVDFPRFISRPVKASLMAEESCSLLGRNLTEEEWQQYVGNKIPYELTCPSLNE